MSEESDWEAGAWQAVRRDWERDIIAAFEGEDQDGDEGDPFPVSAGVRGSGDTA